MEGKKTVKQNQGAGKGHKLASGTAEFLARDRHQGAEGFSREGIWTGMGSEQKFKVQDGLSKLHISEMLLPSTCLLGLTLWVCSGLSGQTATLCLQKNLSPAGCVGSDEAIASHSLDSTSQWGLSVCFSGLICYSTVAISFVGVVDNFS